MSGVHTVAENHHDVIFSVSDPQEIYLSVLGGGSTPCYFSVATILYDNTRARIYAGDGSGSASEQDFSLLLS